MSVATLADFDVLALPACPQCAHVLLGITSPRCPECGAAILAEDFADLNRLIPSPAWELRRYYGRVRSYFRTLLSFLFRPRWAFRSLQSPGHVRDAVVFWIWLIPVAWAIALTLQLPIDAKENGSWLGRVQMIDTIFAVGVRCTTLILSGILVWLPTLAALDLLLWRQRQLFHVLARGTMWSMIWWFWAAVFFGGVGNRLIDYVIMRSGLSWLFDSDGWPADAAYWGWNWGEPPLRGGLGGAWPAQWVPWICYVAGLIATAQAVALLRLWGRCRPAPTPNGSTRGRFVSVVIITGWVLGIYLLLFDRHVHLRFHLLFAVPEFRMIPDWINSEFFYWWDQ